MLGTGVNIMEIQVSRSFSAYVVINKCVTAPIL
jgi:hypothetical protein